MTTQGEDIAKALFAIADQIEGVVGALENISFSESKVEISIPIITDDELRPTREEK